jgi:glycosyltransferase involved in cell wall biosynthesis
MRTNYSTEKSVIIGIDASRIRSGGAIAHLRGILNFALSGVEGVAQIHVWCSSFVAGELRGNSFIRLHSPKALSGNLLQQIIWQGQYLEQELRELSCDILLSVDASTFCRFQPGVVISQDLLSYEPGMLKDYKFGFDWLRIRSLFYVQNAAIVRASGVIFLSRYAGTLIQKSTGLLKDVCYIPHGVDGEFAGIGGRDKDSRGIQCLYVSNALHYKNHPEVVEAIAGLRSEFPNISLVIVGGGDGPAQRRLDEAIKANDPKGEFVFQHGFLRGNDLRNAFKSASVFIFASRCENLPVTLIEAMSSGLPIASSDRGPMPEVLRDGGLYFDPQEPREIGAAVRRIIANPQLAERLSLRSMELSREYTWEKCSRLTFEYTKYIWRKYNRLGP